MILAGIYLFIFIFGSGDFTQDLLTELFRRVIGSGDFTQDLLALCLSDCEVVL